MNQKIILGAIIAIIAIALGAYFVSSSKNNSQVASDSESSQQADQKSDDAMMMEDKENESMMMEDKDSMTKDGQDDAMMMEKAGSYEDYSAQAVQTALADGKKVVLFFHAIWCPDCKAADAAFKANADQIPANTVVFKTDYDNNSDLKTKYGVTTQHTFVQIDQNLNKITAWVSGDVAKLKSNLK
ncbi:MAG: thioredoxin family protein [Candidatus Doudnabacteria bacterium]